MKIVEKNQKDKNIALSERKILGETNGNSFIIELEYAFQNKH